MTTPLSRKKERLVGFNGHMRADKCRGELPKENTVATIGDKLKVRKSEPANGASGHAGENPGVEKWNPGYCMLLDAPLSKTWLFI
jgi:hypothetical protein